MKVLFKNKYLADSENLAYPHQWLGDRFTAFAQLLKEKGKKYNLECASLDEISIDEADAFVWWEIYRSGAPELEELKKTEKPVILIATEPPTVCPGNYDPINHQGLYRILTYRRSLTKDNEKYSFMFPMYFEPVREIPQIPYQQKKNCVLIAHIHEGYKAQEGELYSERERILRWFAENEPEKLDHYCKHSERTVITQCYQGEAIDKMEVMSKYRFAICYENTSTESEYISEKIFDCFYSGCVPIYLGSPDIGRFIPEDCFIDRRKYNSEEELYHFLDSMSVEKYQEYLNHIRVFLSSDFVKAHYSEKFSDLLLHEILGIWK